MKHVALLLGTKKNAHTKNTYTYKRATGNTLIKMLINFNKDELLTSDIFAKLWNSSRLSFQTCYLFALPAPLCFASPSRRAEVGQIFWQWPPFPLFLSQMWHTVLVFACITFYFGDVPVSSSHVELQRDRAGQTDRLIWTCPTFFQLNTNFQPSGE